MKTASEAKSESIAADLERRTKRLQWHREVIEKSIQWGIEKGERAVDVTLSMTRVDDAMLDIVIAEASLLGYTVVKHYPTEEDIKRFYNTHPVMQFDLIRELCDNGYMIWLVLFASPPQTLRLHINWN